MICLSGARLARRILLFAVIAAVAAPSTAAEPEERKKANVYFGNVKKVACAELADLKSDLMAAATACDTIEEDCGDAHRALSRLFGGLHRRDLPDLLVYIDRDGEGSPLEPRLNVLLWKGQVTPYLFGARHIWAVIFSPERLPLDARITTIVKRESNPFTALQGLISLSPPEPEAKAPISETVPVYWDPVARDCTELWIGWARLGIEVDSVNRLTISVRQATHTLTVTETEPKEERTETVDTKTTMTRTRLPGASGAEVKTVTTKTENLDPKKCSNDAVKPCHTRVTTTTATTGSDTDTTKIEDVSIDPQVTLKRTAGARTEQLQRKMEGPDPVSVERNDPPTSFGALSAHFSNSRRSRAGFGIGLGVTDDVDDTALGQVPSDATVGTTDQAVNAYALAKVYIRRPRVRVGRKRPGRRPSVAFIAGTNVGEGTFEELVFGFSVGHVFGNVGFVAGVNRVKPKQGDSGRKSKPFLAVEYSF